MRDPQMPDPRTVSDLKEDLRYAFGEAWKREIEDANPDAEITKEEITRWTGLAAAKMELAIKALEAETIARFTNDSH